MKSPRWHSLGCTDCGRRHQSSVGTAPAIERWGAKGERGECYHMAAGYWTLVRTSKDGLLPSNFPFSRQARYVSSAFSVCRLSLPLRERPETKGEDEACRSVALSQRGRPIRLPSTFPAPTSPHSCRPALNTSRPSPPTSPLDPTLLSPPTHRSTHLPDAHHPPAGVIDFQIEVSELEINDTDDGNANCTLGQGVACRLCSNELSRALQTM